MQPAPAAPDAVVAAAVGAAVGVTVVEADAAGAGVGALCASAAVVAMRHNTAVFSIVPTLFLEYIWPFST